MTPTPKPKRSPWRGLLRLIVGQPLWALPFALFFGTLFGGSRDAYLLAYQFSLVFAFSIGLALWATTHFIVPRLRTDHDSPGGSWTLGAWHVGMSVAGSYLAAIFIHFFVQPGFLGNWRQFAISTMFTLIFVGLFSAASFARVFYVKAVDRARAVEQTRAELAQAELRALRAQIHPHFLFNTLNSIAALISVDPKAAEETTHQLADAFRYTLRASGLDQVRLGDELQFVRTVLAIEQTRFGERLRVVEDIEPGVESLMVPSLLLQPIVENAVRHGAGGRLEGGTVRIGARRDGERLVIAIEDDGPGFDPAAARAVAAGPAGSAAPAGFGLHSVRERLRVAGPPHALAIETPSGGGTRVVLSLPVSPSPGAVPGAAVTTPSAPVRDRGASA